MDRTRLRPLALCVLAAIVASCSDSTRPNADPNGVAYSFVVFGCNRVAAGDTAGDPSTANVNELTQTFKDIAAISPKPNFLFFAGDEILGATPDSTVLAKQLTAWVALYQASVLPATGIELVALPGNHETQSSTKLSYAAAERNWLKIMAPYITRGGNGPGAGGPDNLQTDQSHLTYSFDYKDSHFVMLNTDPTGADWHVPTYWVEGDLAAARAKGQAHIFVIGHKPGYSYPTIPTDGLGEDPAAQATFWNVLVANKVEAMFSAHNHVFYRNQPQAGKTWMVIAGNGGSALEATIDLTIAHTGSYYGYTVVSVTNAGQVFAKSYGRDVPAAGYTAAVTAATTMRDSINLTWGAGS
ncbi:MAG TPA: metallophosphoesterase [Gemmatimonadaceae bacterium]|nr:metallophosphoesterase [Gemmatimonadaceae bacterium]